MNFIIITIILFFLAPFSLHGQVTTEELKQGNFIGRNLKILKSSKKLTLRNAIENNNFEFASTEVPRFGYVYDDIWAKLEIKNNSISIENIFFEFRGP